MRIWTILAATPLLAVGFSLWKCGQWAGSEENWYGDGTVQALEEHFYYALALLFFAASIVVLFLGNARFRRRIWAIVRAVASSF
jgi:hypothetical protein